MRTTGGSDWGQKWRPWGRKTPNKVILELTFDFRESFALILCRISTEYFLKRSQRLSLFPSPCLVKTGIQNPRLQVKKSNLWSEIPQWIEQRLTRKRLISLTPHLLFNLMLRTRRILLSGFKKIIKLYTIFNHQETKHFYQGDTLEIISCGAHVLRCGIWIQGTAPNNSRGPGVKPTQPSWFPFLTRNASRNGARVSAHPSGNSL